LTGLRTPHFMNDKEPTRQTNESRETPPNPRRIIREAEPAPDGSKVVTEIEFAEPATPLDEALRIEQTRAVLALLEVHRGGDAG